MKRMTTAALALLAGMSASAAGAAAVIVYDRGMSERFETKREIVDAVQAEFGEAAAYESGDELPDGIAAQIKPGARLPDGVETTDPPAALGDLPRLGEGTEWRAAGNHLVEIDADGRVVMAVYDVLP